MDPKSSQLTRREFIKITGTATVAGALMANFGPLFADPGNESKSLTLFFEQNFGLDAASIQKLLAQALEKGGDYADIYAQYGINNSLSLEEGIIKNATKSIAAGVGIRVVKGDQTGYAYVEDITPQNLAKAAQTAAAIANEKKSFPAIKVDHQSVTNWYPLEAPASEVVSDEKITLIKNAESRAFAADKRVMRVNVSFADGQTLIMVANSKGVMMVDSQPMLRFNVSVVAGENGQIQSARQSGGGRIGMEYFKKVKSAELIAQEAVDEVILLLSAKDAPSGPMPVVLGAGDSGILLHEAIGHPLEADFNRKGTSAYSGRIGEKVASELCTIYDGGNLPNDRGSINFDDEAIRSSKTILIEKGILRGYMHDYISAQFYKVPQSGNGRRESYAYYPIPRMTITYLDNGDMPREEIFKGVKKGIYCQSFSGGQVDISNGDFVFNPTVAYLIEDGKLSYPVKNFTLIGNGPEVLTKVTRVANDFKFSDGKWTCGKGQRVPVGVGLPTVLVSEITVGGNQG